MIGFTIDGYNLQDPDNGLIVTDSDIYSMPTVRLDHKSLAERDGSHLLDKRLQYKAITINGSLIKPNIEELDHLIDELKNQVNKERATLIMDYGGTNRNYTVTLQGFGVNRVRGLSTADYKLEFMSEVPFGESDDIVTILDDVIDTASETYLVDILGNYKAEPYIRIVYSAITDGTQATVSVQNASTFIGTSIMRDWANGDVIEIDNVKKTVLVNGMPVEYSGRFAEWQAGKGNISVVDSFTSRAGAIQARMKPRYI